MGKLFIAKIFSQLILCAFLWGVTPATAIEAPFPDLGEHLERVISIRSERLIGEMILQKIYGSGFALEDPIVNEYLQEIGLKFNTQASMTDFKLHFFGVDTPELNAFAFFGGHIAVHSGLILAVENESELAAVLAHETAHITQHHLARILANNRKMLPFTFVEILAALAIGTLGEPDMGVHLATAAMAGHLQQLINFTREHEQEADRIGIQLLAKTQFDPAAMASVFQRMKQNAYYRDLPPDYLLTHPLFDSRIADAQNRAEQFSYRQAPDSLFFQLVRARLEAIKEENVSKKLSRLQETLNSGRYQHKTVAQYSYAVALLNHQKGKEALPILKELNLRHPEEWIIALTLAEAEALTGGLQSALKRSQTLLKLHPNNYAITLQYANFLLQNEQPKIAIKLLFVQRKTHMADPILHQTLAKAYSLDRQPTQLHRSQAEWHFARGEFKEAFKQLDLAAEYSEHDPQTLSQIKARKAAIRDIQEEQRGLKL